MNTGTPASTPSTRRYFQRPGPRAPKGRGHAKLITTGLLAAFVLAVVAAAFLHVAPSAEAQASTLVSNTGQTSSSAGLLFNATVPAQAQRFTTGTSNAGYTIHSVGFKFGTISDTATVGNDLEVTINKPSDANPGDAICTLTDPVTFTSGEVNTFHAPTTGEGCPTLTKNTTYYVVVTRVATSGTSTINAAYTTSDSEDSGAAAGWSINNVGTQSGGSTWSDGILTVLNSAFQIEIEGEAATPEAVVKNTGKTTATNKATLSSTVSRFAQRFTADADAHEFSLYSISIDFDEIESTTTVGGDIAVQLHNETSSLPGTSLCVLENPSSFSASGLHTFTAPSSNPCPTLEAGTTYYVAIQKDNTNTDTIALTTTAFLTVDLDSAYGWSTGTIAHRYVDADTAWSQIPISRALKIVVQGTGLLTNAAPRAPDLTAAAKNQSIELEWTLDDHGASDITRFEYRIKETSGGTYPETWTDTGATASNTGGSSTIGSLTNGTNYTVQVRAVNTQGEGIPSNEVTATPDLEELTETQVPFGWALTPEGTAGGEKFRLMFLTDADMATSSDIDVYNTYVQAQAAAGHADIQEHANQFRVLASTADDDARDNTETTSSDTDAPIYWLNGAKVADNYADLYDETWDEEVNRRTAAGDLSTTSHIVWTGSDDDGTGRQETGVSVALGETSVRQGELDNSSSTRDPLSALTVTAATNTAPFYALSGIFRVEPNTEATTTHTLAVKKNPRVADQLYTNHDRARVRDPEGVPFSGFLIQWFRYDPATDTETEIEGATNEPYFVTHTDADLQLSFTVSFTDDEGNPEILVSERTEPVLPYDVLLRNKPGHDEVDAPLNATFLRYAQKFNTGHSSTGYHVESIGFHLSQVHDPATAASHLEVRIQLPDNNGNPGDTVCTLRDPAAFSAPGIHHFTNPPSVGRCPNLERNTDYFAVIYRTTTSATDIINITVTTETDEAEASSANWTIEGASLRYTNNAWQNSPSSHRAVIEVKGDQAREITIPIDSPLIPDDLSGGSFRLIFVASAHAATGTDINRYQTDFYDAIANDDTGEPETLIVRQLNEHGRSHMRLVASTVELDARDHTFSTYTSSHKGVPIFWYKGAIVANDYEDLYDGNWQNENQPRDWHGDLVTDLNQEYWTGSNNDGTAKTRSGDSKALGQTEVETGKLNQSGSSPLSHAADDPTEVKSMFAITGIFKLENHEAVGLPSITGIPRVGETLTADTSAITDGNGTDRATFTYQWLRVDGNSTFPIAGATSKTYRPTADLAGKRINLTMSMNDNHGYGTDFQSVLIDPTEPIQPEDLIVENMAVGTPTTGPIGANTRQAQGFTASADARPFALTEARFRFGSVDNPAAASPEITVTLNEDSSGFPGDPLCTLTNPPRIEPSATSSFGAPDLCPALTPGQKYHLVLERGGDASGDIEIYRTPTAGQNPGSAPGWSWITRSRYTCKEAG